MIRDDYCPRRNSYEGWKLAIATLREQCIRRGQVTPAPGDAREVRWASEGDVPANQLETVTHQPDRRR